MLVKNEWVNTKVKEEIKWKAVPQVKIIASQPTPKTKSKVSKRKEMIKIKQK